jgi:hypothetical protein
MEKTGRGGFEPRSGTLLSQDRPVVDLISPRCRSFSPGADPRHKVRDHTAQMGRSFGADCHTNLHIDVDQRGEDDRQRNQTGGKCRPLLTQA